MNQAFLKSVQWSDDFVARWSAVTEGRLDQENAYDVAAVAYLYRGDQPAHTAADEYLAASGVVEAQAKAHFSEHPEQLVTHDLPEDEDADPVGAPVKDPRRAFAAAAVDAGLIRDGDPLDDMQVQFAERVVSLCAAIADEYENPQCPEDTVGDHIRAVMLDA